MHLEGRAKLGFYPTPRTLLTIIASYIQPLPLANTGILFDPCAGDGEPLSTLAKTWQLQAWGSELHPERAEQAATHCTRFLRSDAFQLTMSRTSCHALFLNPPYDQQRGRRTEQDWLMQWHSVLIPDGLLCFIIQERTIPALLESLITLFRDLHIARFPEPEYGSFGQVVIFARKRRSPYFSQATYAQWRASLTHLPVLSNQPSPLFTFPPQRLVRAPLFTTSWYDLKELGPKALHTSWTQPRVTTLLTLPSTHACQPLMPLRPAHTAQLITAGFMNNELLQTPDYTYLVKGSSQKITVTKTPITEGAKIIERQKEQFRPKIFAWDLHQGPTFGQFLEIQTAPAHTAPSPIPDTEVGIKEKEEPLIEKIPPSLPDRPRPRPRPRRTTILDAPPPLSQANILVS